ncbi:NUDIX hydrolase [Microbacterium terrisoli]|jgi:8-oxo-dGTP pyrophosphatase MutT (NUDIX family)|uniref:NUDIX hydrolase n=1 Tax=Microbacterium terrisoli TaxID=3242192 RepID=UPI0028050B14|nr:NUDIX domain-containing protein [Microbacterium protaetiae]
MDDRALHDLQSAVGAVRGPGADPDAALARAGTAIVVRDGAAGPEVLMMHRPERGSFAGAWVFPGGRVEPVDEVAGAEPIDDARRAAARETAEEVGMVVDAEHLVPISRWDPPVGIPKRIRTWFYLARAGAGELTLSTDEVVEALWVRPEDALQRHARGELTLYPPTWVTLQGLAGHATGDAMLAAAAGRGIHVFATNLRRDADATVFVWRPDAAYDPAVPLEAPGARHRLVTAALPWQYIVTPG